MSRDVIPGGVALNPSQQATIEVRWVTRATSTGGMLIQFNEVLYRMLAQTTREAKDINNINAFETNHRDAFTIGSCGGNNRNGISSTFSTTPGEEGQTLGPQIGTSTSVVSNTDFDLGNRILHGSGAGQMLHSGAFVDFLTKDEVSPFWQFDIMKVFVNDSGGAITVNEIGCNFGFKAALSIQKWSHCMARHQVSPGVVVNNGEAIQVVYTLRAQM